MPASPSKTRPEAASRAASTPVELVEELCSKGRQACVAYDASGTDWASDVQLVVATVRRLAAAHPPAAIVAALLRCPRDPSRYSEAATLAALRTVARDVATTRARISMNSPKNETNTLKLLRGATAETQERVTTLVVAILGDPRACDAAAEAVGARRGAARSAPVPGDGPPGGALGPRGKLIERRVLDLLPCPAPPSPRPTLPRRSVSTTSDRRPPPPTWWTRLRDFVRPARLVLREDQQDALAAALRTLGATVLGGFVAGRGSHRAQHTRCGSAICRPGWSATQMTVRS